MIGEMKFLVANAWAAFNNADANTTLWRLDRYFDADPGLEPRIKTGSAHFPEFLRLLKTMNSNGGEPSCGTRLRRGFASKNCQAAAGDSRR